MLAPVCVRLREPAQTPRDAAPADVRRRCAYHVRLLRVPPRRSTRTRTRTRTRSRRADKMLAQPPSQQSQLRQQQAAGPTLRRAPPQHRATAAAAAAHPSQRRRRQPRSRAEPLPALPRPCATVTEVGTVGTSRLRRTSAATRRLHALSLWSCAAVRGLRSDVRRTSRRCAACDTPPGCGRGRRYGPGGSAVAQSAVAATAQLADAAAARSTQHAARSSRSLDALRRRAAPGVAARTVDPHAAATAVGAQSEVASARRHSAAAARAAVPCAKPGAAAAGARAQHLGR